MGQRTPKTRALRMKNNYTDPVGAWYLATDWFMGVELVIQKRLQVLGLENAQTGGNQRG